MILRIANNVRYTTYIPSPLLLAPANKTGFRLKALLCMQPTIPKKRIHLSFVFFFFVFCHHRHYLDVFT
ncbi:hypothetical protein BCR42DRAFT_420408, partial [Absidia repens]